METPTVVVPPDGPTPAPEVEKPLQAWAPYELTHIERATEAMARHGLLVKVLCAACLQAGRNFELSVIPDELGRRIAECDCTRHWLRRGRR